MKKAQVRKTTNGICVYTVNEYGQKDGYVIYLYPSGCIRNLFLYKNGIRKQVLLGTFEPTSTRASTIARVFANGWMYEYFRDGNIAFVGQHINGTLYGEFKEYNSYNNGLALHCTCYDGDYQGEYRSYWQHTHEVNALREHGYMKDSEYHGYVIMYSTDGGIESDYFFNEGEDITDEVMEKCGIEDSLHISESSWNDINLMYGFKKLPSGDLNEPLLTN